MKRILICFANLILAVGCSPSKSELYKETDFFVESLHTTRETYTIWESAGHAKITSDELYRIAPLGRLINVKILKKVADRENAYEDLKNDLADYYKNDDRVNKVYINKMGTIMIDCRN